jgi:putative membrane protein
MLLCACLLQASVAALSAADTTYRNENRGQFSASDYKFAREAALGGQMEVELGRIASQKAVNPSVQQFGQRMVTDHSKAGDKLKEIAMRNSATLPMELTATEQHEVNKLNKLSGQEFDKEYVSLMVKDHKKDLKDFQHAAKTADNADLRLFAQTTSVTIQEHLTMIEDIDRQLSNSRPTASVR